MKTKTKAILCAALIAIMVGVTYAAIKYTATISNTMKIEGYQIKLWDVQADAEVTAINWGTFTIGQTKDSDTALGLPTATHKLAIKNTGDRVAYIGWQIDPTTPLPTGVTISGWHANTETEPYQQTWNENMFTYFVTTASVSSWRIKWTLTTGVDASKGDFTFNILLLAADSSTG